MASEVVRIFDKVNKDPKEAWFSTSLSDVNNRINSAGIPPNAEITKVRLYVNADFDGGGLGSPQVYLQFGFGSEGSISTLLMGDTKIGKELVNYPSDSGVEIPSTYVNKYSTFGFSSAIGARFVAYIHTAHILVTELTVNYADVVIEYNIPTYTATFKNYDGTTLQTVIVERGSTPSYTGATPTRAQDAQYTYTFSGWSPAVGALTADTTYTAQFKATLRKYTVRWYNEDGTLLETDTTEYGKIPTYNGATPTIPPTTQFTFEFATWDTAVTEVTKDVVYKAVYNKIIRKYYVEILTPDENIGTITGAVSGEYEYGTKLTLTANPKDGCYFDRWIFDWGLDTSVNPADNPITFTVLGEEAVFARFLEIPKYQITIEATEGGKVSAVSGEYAEGTKLTFTAFPDQYYKFVGWSDGETSRIRTVTVSADATYKAIFEKQKGTVIVELWDIDNIVLVENGELGTVTGLNVGENVLEAGQEFTLNVIPNGGYGGYVRILPSIPDEDTCIPPGDYEEFPQTFRVNSEGTSTIYVWFSKLPPVFTSVEMIYCGKQISEQNKVIAGQGFIISVAVT